MSKGKEVKRKRGDSLRERFLSQGKQPEQTAEQLAEAFADDVAEKIRDALDKKVQQGEHLKQEMADHYCPVDFWIVVAKPDGTGVSGDL